MKDFWYLYKKEIIIFSSISIFTILVTAFVLTNIYHNNKEVEKLRELEKQQTVKDYNDKKATEDLKKKTKSNSNNKKEYNSSQANGKYFVFYDGRQDEDFNTDIEIKKTELSDNLVAYDLSDPKQEQNALGTYKKLGLDIKKYTTQLPLFYKQENSRDGQFIDKDTFLNTKEGDNDE